MRGSSAVLFQQELRQTLIQSHPLYETGNTYKTRQYGPRKHSSGEFGSTVEQAVVSAAVQREGLNNFSINLLYKGREEKQPIAKPPAPEHRQKLRK